jgi:beta-galactosidase
MVALWTLEACAHGAELTSYFRWRQAPFAQEQMHAGLLRPDSTDAEAAGEARAAAAVIADIGPQATAKAPVALVFSYEAAWVVGIQPQGRSFRYLELVFETYSALRQRGLDVDIVAPSADLSGYRMVLVPTLPIVPEDFAEKLASLDCPVLLGPRSGSKTASFCIPEGLAPGALKAAIPLTVTRVESLRDGITEPAEGFTVTRWREDVASNLAPELSDSAGRGVVYRHGPVRYCAIWPDRALLRLLVERMAGEAGVALLDLPEGIRIRRTATHVFTFNYAAQPVVVPHLAATLGPASWHIAPR